MNNNKIKVLIVGCGNMGLSHARAYQKIPEFEICGLVDKNTKALEQAALTISTKAAQFTHFSKALKTLKPDAVCICTYPETHAKYTIEAINSGAHVFVEKPLGVTVKEASDVIKIAKQKNKKVVVGYILRHHPTWNKFIQIAQNMGKPLVMRMNLNQQSSGKRWETHKQLLKTMSPIVDCGVHYVDVMCQMTKSKPILVSAICARLTKEIKKTGFNYGQLQVKFEDGSVGWYEAGWGPMMSEVAFFVKDVIGPKGCVSMVGMEKSDSSDINSHTKTNCLKIHYADTDKDGNFIKQDEYIDTHDEPSHDDLCKNEQQFFLKSILEDLNLDDHLNDALNSLKIVLAADKSAREGRTIRL